jgi:hypothetical protein
VAESGRSSCCAWIRCRDRARHVAEVAEAATLEGRISE